MSDIKNLIRGYFKIDISKRMDKILLMPEFKNEPCAYKWSYTANQINSIEVLYYLHYIVKIITDK